MENLGLLKNYVYLCTALWHNAIFARHIDKEALCPSS